jgi:hypothetical protein
MLVPDCARVVHKGHVGSNEIIQTFAARHGGVLGPLTFTEIAELHRDAWIANMIPSLHSAYVYDSCDTFDLGDPSAGGGTASGSATAGAAGASSAGTQVCAIATLKTALRGKSYQGRSFLSPVTAAAVASNGQTLDGGWRTLIQASYDGYMSDVAGGIGDDGKLVIASPTLGTYEDVTSILVRSYLGTQRRRVN